MKAKKIVVGLLSICLLGATPLVLTSCTGGDNTVQNQVTLSNDESSVYNSIVGSISSFKDPGSVTLTWVSVKPLLGGRYVKISAKNSFGGYVTNCFQCSGYSLRSVDDVVGSSDSSISVSKINQKLNQYKSSMGYN